MTQNKKTQPALFRSGPNYADGSDALANYLGQYIDIYHIPSKQSVQFKAFLTSFTDQYSSDWNSEDVLGRMDPIQTFKGTKRTISLGWDVPAASFSEARTNLKKASLLVSMLYPEYESGGGATTMTSPPLFKLKFMNLIQDSSQPSAPRGNARETGLLGTISGFTYEPDLESGFFQPVDEYQAGDVSSNPDKQVEEFRYLVGEKDRYKLFPQTIKFQAEFTVLHQHRLGWQKGTRAKGAFATFPYTALHEGDSGEPPVQQTNVAPQSTGKNKSITQRNAAAAMSSIEQYCAQMRDPRCGHQD